MSQATPVTMRTAPTRVASPVEQLLTTTAPVSNAPVVTAPSHTVGRRAATRDVPTIVGDQTSFRRSVGPSDLRVFPIALGGDVFGWTADGPQTQQVLDRYYLHGGNFIDTADCYAGGRSEFMIGGWMQSRRNRDELVISTKVGKGADFPGVTATAITRSVEDSLERLRTDRIDLLYLHLDDPRIPFDETLCAVDELIRAGKVRYFGASAHSADRLFEARVAAGQLGIAQMVATQTSYSLVDRKGYERGMACAAHDLDLAVIPRFTLAGGFLTGKYRSRADLGRGQRGSELYKLLGRHGQRVLEAVEQVAREQQASMATVALAWLLSKPGVVAPVVSVSRVAQVHELTAAPELPLTRDQLAMLDRASAGF